ncbi:MAG: GGDEF domain-containing protein [Ruminococcus sp.]|nr:GGDEF domain-containing protein [Ruminococcus sp.]
MNEQSDKKLIAVCLSLIKEEDRFYFLKELNKEVCKAGYRLIVFNSCTDLYDRDSINDEGEKAVFDLIPYDRIAALIVFPRFFFDEKLISRIVGEGLRRGLPVISVDRPIEGCKCFSFTYSNSFEKICDHLIEDHGARRLFMMAGGKGNQFSDERIAGFKHSLERAGIEYSDDLVGYGDFWEEPARQQMEKWFSEEKREIPDAIVCANDMMAISVSNYLQKMGVKIPGQCIVTGFDGIMQAYCHIPHITTCRQDYEKMGELIVEGIEKMLRGEDIPELTEVPFKIVRSQSCGCEKITADDINDIVELLLRRYKFACKRQEVMCSVQANVSLMTTPDNLMNAIINEFIFPTNIFAINEDIFKPPHFGLQHKGQMAFTDNFDVLIQRYHWVQEPPGKADRSQLVPMPEKLMSKELPIIVTAVHYVDLVMGYCVFQPEFELDEYEKIHSFMSAINASIGIYHSQELIRSMNEKLISVNSELENLYIHDYMTGLLNRRGFYMSLSERIEKERDTGRSALFISADMDGLKTINDTYGHIEGDFAITAMARALTGACRNDEICARFGGDEFTVACFVDTGSDESYFTDFCQRFREILDKIVGSSNKPYTVGVSLGYCSEKLEGDIDADTMIMHADNKMYEEKKLRKGR